MLGNPISKSFRLASWLGRNPSFVKKYVATASKAPLDVQMPWFSWPAIEFLREVIGANSRVFEYGSGGSTFFCAQRAKMIRSVEDDPQWFRLIKSRIDISGLQNVTYLHASSDRQSGQRYIDTDFVKALDEPFDAIIIDGSENWPDEIVRTDCFQHARNYVAPGGLIVMDDAWRYDGKIADHGAKMVRRFEGVGPGRYGVTRTDVYLY
jgi:predicted O-methyltransferase YrrM